MLIDGGRLLWLRICHRNAPYQHPKHSCGDLRTVATLENAIGTDVVQATPLPYRHLADQDNNRLLPKDSADIPHYIAQSRHIFAMQDKRVKFALGLRHEAFCVTTVDLTVIQRHNTRKPVDSDFLIAITKPHDPD